MNSSISARFVPAPISHTDNPDPTATTTIVTKVIQPMKAEPATTGTLHYHDTKTVATNPDHGETHQHQSSFGILKIQVFYTRYQLLEVGV